MTEYNRRSTMRYSYASAASFKEKNNMQEKRMLRMSFHQVKEMDPLNLKKKFRNARNDEFLESFYTTCSILPIMIVLSILFYSLWFVSPKSQNVRIYQQDIYQWNKDQIADKMGHLQFEFSVIPVVKYEDGTELPKDAE